MQPQPERQVLCVQPGTVPTLNVLGAGVRFLCEAEDTGGAFSVMDNDLPMGAGPPPHRHDWDEAYYIISGTVDFMLDGKSVRAGAGSFVYAPGGTLHGFQGASQEPARMLVIDAPAHAAAFFREVDRAIAGPEDYSKVPAIGDAHGIAFAVPQAS